MKLTLWSAGENGNTAKKNIAFSILMLLLWFVAVISIVNGGPYIEYPEFGKGEGLVVALLFMVITFFIPFIAINMVIASKRALARNMQFTVEVIKHTEQDKILSTNPDMIVFGDKDGIVITDNLQAYNDWACFYTADSIYDFFVLKDRLDNKVKSKV